MHYCRAMFDLVVNRLPFQYDVEEIVRSSATSDRFLQNLRTPFKLALSDSLVIDFEEPVGYMQLALATSVFLAYDKEK
jgi:hypothetical protein